MRKLLAQLFATTLLLTYACMSFAIVNLSNPITVTYLNNGTTDFVTNTSGNAYYEVTVNAGITPTDVPLSLSVGSTNNTPGLVVQQITSGSPSACGSLRICGSTFPLTAGQSCCLAFTLTSARSRSYKMRPLVQTTPAAFSGQAPAALPVVVSATSLSISPSTLALSVSDTSLNAALTGHPRRFTVTNTGQALATGLFVTSSGLPTGTSITSTTCGSTLVASGSCTITITPGDAASNCTSGTAPTPGTVSISANNAISTQSDVVVLSYGCLEQSGYIYAINDSYSDYPVDGSIGGTVLHTTDDSTRIVWDSRTACTTFPYNHCYVTSADSTSNGTNIAGGNTYLIYNVLTATHAEDVTSYAAGLCTGTFSGYSDWYLPAICEMGYDTSLVGSGCGSRISPTLQNIQSNLINIGLTDIAGLTTGQYYWSSTEDSSDPTQQAWVQSFALSGDDQSLHDKGILLPFLGVRCSRTLTLN
ncbi:MAG: DUF1566 domain-containing protein [Legionellales bacterium]|nr:DUF1566 domain-containing protein [Legionellales bacterium]